MRKELEDLVNRFDAQFYRMQALVAEDPSHRDEREAIEDAFDAAYAEAMRLIKLIKD